MRAERGFSLLRVSAYGRWHVAVLLTIAAVCPVDVASGAATPVGPFEVDLASRESVRRLYYSVHEASENIAINWTGSIAGCNPGSVSQEYLDATLTRINYFRAMAGVPSDVTFTAENNARAQAAALIMSARNGAKPELSHQPPNDWTCWTQQGHDAAGVSNLTWGTTGPTAIDSLIKDGDVAGHRRTLLNPQILSMGSGSVPASDRGVAAEAQLMVDNPSPPAERRPARDQFVAWPPKGFVPYQTVYPIWTFILRDANFASATVTMQRPDGSQIPVSITHREDFAGPGLVWLANGLQEVCTADSPQPCSAVWPRPAADESIRVTLGNVIVNGAAQTFTYDVTVFDPALADPSRTLPVITGPAQPALNQASAYSVNDIPNATGYQWRTSKLTPFDLTDGAEAGGVNFDAVVGGYDPVSTSFASTGTSAFRLSTGQTGGAVGFGTQTLTLKRALVPSANSQLTFKTRANRLTNVSAALEVSTDDGATWTAVYTEQATLDTSWQERTAALAPYVGKHVRLRLRAQNTGAGQFACCADEGWYVDDLALRGFQAAEAPVSSEVAAATSFSFTPTDSADYDLQVRPQFFGSGFGEWSQVLRVTVPVPAVAPSISAQPQNAAVDVGGALTFSVTASGTPAPDFVWTRDGADLSDGPGISGARTATLGLSNVQAAQAGVYRVRVSNSAGAVTSSDARLTVNTPQPAAQNDLAGALDGANLQWATSGNASWSPQTAVTHDGMDAAQSGSITDNQASQLQISIAGPVALSFTWKVDSEPGFDFLNVEVDGVRPIPGISGDVDWQRQTLNLGAGTHSVRWIYSKDVSVSRGKDAAWLDEVAVGAAPAAPAPGENGLADATEAPANTRFTTSGDAAWVAQTALSHDGMDAARSGSITHNQSSSFAASVSGPGTLSFWWKVDSEANFDFLTFMLDGVSPFPAITGSVDWQQKSVPLSAGPHILSWTYSKDVSVSVGEDAGWVDQISVQ